MPEHNETWAELWAEARLRGGLRVARLAYYYTPERAAKILAAWHEDAPDLGWVRLGRYVVDKVELVVHPRYDNTNRRHPERRVRITWLGFHLRGWRNRE